MRFCVSCGAVMEDDNHKCSKRHEAGKEGANRRAEHYDVARERQPLFGQRLADGFSLMGG